MLTKSSSDFMSTVLKSISPAFLLQASFILVVVTAGFYLLLLARKTKKKCRKGTSLTAIQRVQRMFEFSFRDLKGNLSED